MDAVRQSELLGKTMTSKTRLEGSVVYYNQGRLVPLSLCYDDIVIPGKLYV